MHAYWAFFRIAFKNSFAYRSSVFMNLFGSVISIVAQLALWVYIFRNNSDMLNYMMAYVVISRVLGILFTNNITDQLGAKIISGDFVTELIKPINLVYTLWSSSFGTICAGMVNQCTLLIIVFLPVLIKVKITILSFALFILVSILGLILSNILYVLIGYLAFVVIETWPYKRLLDDTIRLLSGAVIPIAFFPGWLENVVKCFPFHFIYSFPLRILLNKVSIVEMVSSLVMMILWIFMLLFLLVKIYKWSVKYCIVQGG